MTRSPSAAPVPQAPTSQARPMTARQLSAARRHDEQIKAQQLKLAAEQAQQELSSSLRRWLRTRRPHLPEACSSGPFPGLLGVDRSVLNAGQRLERLLKLATYCGLSARDLSNLIPGLRPVLAGRGDLLGLDPSDRLKLIALLAVLHPDLTDRQQMVALGIPPRMRTLWRVSQVHPPKPRAGRPGEAWPAAGARRELTEGRWSEIIAARAEMLGRWAWETPAPTPDDLSWSVTVPDFQTTERLKWTAPRPDRKPERKPEPGPESAPTAPDPAREARAPARLTRPAPRPKTTLSGPLGAIEALSREVNLSPEELTRRCGLNYRMAAPWLKDPEAVGRLGLTTRLKILRGLEAATGLSQDELIGRLGLSPEHQAHWRGEEQARAG